MTEATRRNVLRYGIAIDLVIVATGVALLMPMPPAILITLFAAAVALSTWKGSWQGGLAAAASAELALLLAVETPAVTLLWFAMIALPAVGLVHLLLSRARRAASPETKSAARLEPEPAVEANQIAGAPILAFRVEAERTARERATRDREEAERRAVEEVMRERARLEEERQRLERDLAERLELERQEVERAAEETLRTRLHREREAIRAELEQQLAAEREALARETERAAGEREALAREAERAAAAKVEAQRDAENREAEKREAEKREADRIAAASPAKSPSVASPRDAAAKSDRRTAKPAPPVSPAPSLLETVSGWFRRSTPAPPRAVNVTTTRVNGNATAPRRPQSASAPPRKTLATSGRPRLLMLERRRGTADTVLPKLRQRGIDGQVVERWVDAVDEIFRTRPDVMFLDVEHPDFDKAYRTVLEKNAQLPVVLTGRAVDDITVRKYAAFVTRPFDADELARLTQQAHVRREELLSLQLVPRAQQASSRSANVRPIPLARPDGPLVRPEPMIARDSPTAAAAPPRSADQYVVTCFSCRAEYDAVDADWCSCLTKERSLVCTNCLACFCKAAPAYKEKFWVEAPPRLFERKTGEARRQQAVLSENPAAEQVLRPLVLAVEDDEEIQAIVHRVCNNLGYGFVYALNGQDGFELAQKYRPNLILSDAFMPKLDGREMCRLLKEDPSFAETRMIVMTGLYTDTKYRSEALKRFHVDDYVAKPVAITDLITMLQKHLEGVSGLPDAEDLHEVHRREVEDDDELDVPLAELLDGPESDGTAAGAAPPPSTRLSEAPRRPDAYAVGCFTCGERFDAVRADWCRCVGRDNTLVCEHCGGCFCKAPASYKERFWVDAPPSLFERKMIGSKRNVVARVNPSSAEVKRPLILLVEDDENVQLIVRTVVTSMGYGFVVGANGQEGLTLAREYRPDLILSDAFMPKLDGREMCRLLKEDPTTAGAKAIIMTGLYTDRKYRNEALDYFRVDDYVAKPLAVDDLIKLFKKHLPIEVAAAG